MTFETDCCSCWLAPRTTRTHDHDSYDLKLVQPNGITLCKLSTSRRVNHMEVKEVFSRLKKEAEYSICVHMVNQPKSVPCLQSFCLDCINKYAATKRRQRNIAFGCPECSAIPKIPDGQFPDFVLQLLCVVPYRICDMDHSIAFLNAFDLFNYKCVLYLWATVHFDRQSRSFWLVQAWRVAESRLRVKCWPSHELN